MSKLKPKLAYLLPVLLVSPSLIWIANDMSVWPWDQAFYGKGSVELFYTLIHSPRRWILQMVKMPQQQAPGISWLGQLFVPLGYVLGSVDQGLLLSILVTQGLTLVLMYRTAWELSAHNGLIAVMGCPVIASAPLFVAMSHQYFAEPLQLFTVTWFLLIMSFAPKCNRATILTQLVAAIAVASSLKQVHLCIA